MLENDRSNIFGHLKCSRYGSFMIVITVVLSFVIASSFASDVFVVCNNGTESNATLKNKSSIETGAPSFCVPEIGHGIFVTNSASKKKAAIEISREEGTVKVRKIRSFIQKIPKTRWPQPRWMAKYKRKASQTYQHFEPEYEYDEDKSERELSICYEPSILKIHPKIFLEFPRNEPQLVGQGFYFADIAKHTTEDGVQPIKLGSFNLLYTFKNDIIVAKIHLENPQNSPGAGPRIPPPLPIRTIPISISTRDPHTQKWAIPKHYTIPVKRQENPIAIILLPKPTATDAVRLYPGYKVSSSPASTAFVALGRDSGWNWWNLRFVGCI